MTRVETYDDYNSIRPVMKSKRRGLVVFRESWLGVFWATSSHCFDFSLLYKPTHSPRDVMLINVCTNYYVVRVQP